MEVLAAGNEYEDLRQIKLECFSYAKEHFQGQVFYNVSRGVQIRVSRTGLNEWFAKTKSYEQAQSIKFLGEILRCAEYSHSAANNHPKKVMSILPLTIIGIHLSGMEKNFAWF